MVKISIIIVTYNSHNLIKDCVDSIQQYADLPASNYEIIIIDNSDIYNHNLLLSKLVNYSISNLKIIKNEKNGGYGQGNNLGIIEAVGDVICIMNPDVRMQSSIMQKTISKFDNKKIALVSYKQLGGANLSFYIKPENQTRFINGILVKFFNKINIFNYRKFYLSGAFFFIDKSKFIEIGLFDDNIFLYYEEPDISNRFISAGYTIQYDKSENYLHLISERPFNEKSFHAEMTSFKYYLHKYNLNQKNIIDKYIQELRFKKFIYGILSKKNKVISITKEIEILRDVFNLKK